MIKLCVLFIGFLLIVTSNFVSEEMTERTFVMVKPDGYQKKLVNF
jgi:hypothetical protein